MADLRPLLTLVLIALGGWLLYLLAPVLTPFLVGGLLAYLGNPAVNALTRWHLPRVLAVILVFVLFLMLVTALLVFIIPAVRVQIVNFSANLPGYLDWLQQTAIPRLQEWLGINIAFDMASLRQTLIGHWREVGDWASNLFLYLSRSGLSVIGWMVNLLLIPVVTFYLLLDWDHLLARIKALLPRRRQAWLSGLARETDEVLGSFLRGQLTVMLALATVYSVGLTLAGLSLALPIGVLAGTVSFIPYVGFLSGLIAALLAGYLQFHDWLPLLWVAGVFLTGQVLESLWLTPRLVGNRIGLHPVAVIFAVMAGGQLFGFTGVLLALPAAAVLKVWLRHVHQMYAGDPTKKRRPPGQPSS